MEDKTKKIIALSVAGTMILTPTACAIGYKADRDHLRTEVEKNSDAGLKAEIEKMKESIDKVNQANNVLTNKVNTLTSENNYYKAVVSDLREDLTQAELSLEMTRAEKEDLQTDYDAVSAQLSAKEEELQQALEDNEADQLLIQTLTEERDSLQAEKTQLQSNLEAMTGDRDEIQARYNNVSAQLSAKEEELENALANVEAKEQIIASLTAERDNLSAEKTQLEDDLSVANSNIESLNQTIADKNSQIASLNATIEENNSKIATLNTEKENLFARISELESQVAQLESDLDNAEAENEDYVMRIATMEAQIISLNNEITRVYGLLESYEDIANSTFEVSFYLGDNNLKTVAVKNGKTVSELPTSDDYVITGWTLEDGTAVDPLTYEITQNTIFYAIYTLPAYRGDVFLISPVVTSTNNFDNAIKGWEGGYGYAVAVDLNQLYREVSIQIPDVQPNAKIKIRAMICGHLNSMSNSVVVYADEDAQIKLSGFITAMSEGGYLRDNYTEGPTEISFGENYRGITFTYTNGTLTLTFDQGTQYGDMFISDVFFEIVN